MSNPQAKIVYVLTTQTAEPDAFFQVHGVFNNVMKAMQVAATILNLESPLWISSGQELEADNGDLFAVITATGAQ